MTQNYTAVHISLFTCICSFTVAALSLVLGYVLIEHGTTGGMSLEFQRGDFKVNFFTFVPGLGFAFFGAAIAWKALDSLIGKGD